MYHLTETKRFGDPLATYLARAHPNLCSHLRASSALGKHTPVRHIWYTAPCSSWYNLGYFLGVASCKRLQESPAAWKSAAAVWNDGLFAILAASILTVLQEEAKQRREANRGFEEDELVVVVCAAIRRVVGPFQLLMDALLTDRDVLARFDLEGLQPDHVQVRLPSDLTGPSATYSYVIRHPRSRSSGQSAWQDKDLQHHGQQTVDELNYIMESRPEKGLFVFMHEAATPSETGRSARGWQNLSERIQIERELGIPSYSPDCDRPEQLPLTSRDATDQFVASTWRRAVQAASAHTCRLRNEARDAVIKATGLLGDQDGDGPSMSVHDTLRSLGSQELVLQDERSAKRRGETRQEGPPPLADFGCRAWPRDPVRAVADDIDTAQLRGLLVELGWRLVDHVALQVQGKTAVQLSVPLLDPLPGYDSPNYSATAASALPGKPSLLTAFVLCVWAVYQCQRAPESKSYAIMSVHHKASITEEGGSDEGITWWSRACNADREAVILIDSADAELLLQDAEHYRRPPKPRAPPPVLLHWDGH